MLPTPPHTHTPRLEPRGLEPEPNSAEHGMDRSLDPAEKSPPQVQPGREVWSKGATYWPDGGRPAVSGAPC